MDWIKHFNQDHMEVLLLLTKLDGNLQEVKHLGKVRSGILLECEEFLEVVEKVILPHFQAEEEHLYPTLVKRNPQASGFVEIMLQEHQELYEDFERFKVAVKAGEPADLITSGEGILRFLKDHILKEEKEIPVLLQGS